MCRYKTMKEIVAERRIIRAHISLCIFIYISRCIIKVYGAVGIATGGVGDCTTEGVGVRVPVG